MLLQRMHSNGQTFNSQYTEIWLQGVSKIPHIGNIV